MLFLNMEMCNFILNFRIDDLCCVSLEAGEVFGILILVNFGIILIGKIFFFFFFFFFF